MMREMNPDQNPPEWILKSLELHTGIFFGFYGFWMFYVVFYLTTDQWLFFKTLGFYLCFAVFFVVEMIFLRLRAKKMHERALKHQALNNTINR